MEKDKDVFFKELNDKEKLSKFSQLPVSEKPQMVFWRKGENTKYRVEVVNYFRTRKEFQVEGDIPDSFFNDEVLFSFDLKGVHFFGQCKIISFAKSKIYVDCFGKVFKSERRKNFRMLTYPHHQVFANVRTEDQEVLESNVIQLKTGMSETGIFTNFLNMVNEQDGGDRSLEGYLRIRVLDISVTGMALQLSDLEKAKLPMKQDLGEVIVEFNGEPLKIPGVEILYTLEGMARDKKTRIYKAGAQFLNIDTNTDEILARKINQTLRSLESEFEDFLK